MSKRKLLVVLNLLLCAAFVFGEEKDSKINENPKVDFSVPFFGFNPSGKMSQWFDFYSGQEISVKDMNKILESNVDSQRYVKKSKINNVLFYSFCIAGVTGIVSSFFITDKDIKSGCNDIGFAFCLSSSMFLYLREYNYKKAVIMYDQSVLGLNNNSSLQKKIKRKS